LLNGGKGRESFIRIGGYTAEMFVFIPTSSSSAFPLPSAVSPSVFPPPSAVFPSTCALFASSSTARDHRPHRNPHWGPSDPSSPLHREFVQVPRKKGALHLSREHKSVENYREISKTTNSTIISLSN